MDDRESRMEISNIPGADKASGENEAAKRKGKERRTGAGTRFAGLAAGVLVLSVAAAVGLFVYSPGLDSFLALHLPFVWVGRGLRALSLSGAFGNGAAWICYLLLAAAPAGLWLWRRIRRKGDWADLLLLLLSGFGFYMWYCFINPFVFTGGLAMGGGEKLGDMGLVILSCAWWGILCAWAVLAAFDRSIRMEEKPAQRAIRRLQGVLRACVLLYIVYDGYFRLLVLMKTLRKLTAQQDMTGILVCGTEGLAEYVLDGFAVAILFLGIRLLTAMQADWYQERVEELARRMADTGRNLVYAVMLCNVGMNLFKLLLSESIRNLDLSVVLPVVPLILALAAYILGDYFESARKQHEDMGMII